MTPSNAPFSTRAWLIAAVICFATVATAWIAFLLLLHPHAPAPVEPALAAEPELPVIPSPEPPIEGFLPDQPFPLPFPAPATAPERAVESGSQFVVCLLPDREGTLWIGTESGGVYRFNPHSTTQQWAQYTADEGLGDNYIYALARDQQGRIWAGHNNHGVSVFNGEKWQNYEPVGGLSRPDSLSGPLGERVFHIAVSPLNGDVWIATNCGLSRYSPITDSWSYITQLDGLPSNLIQRIVFAKDGTVYLATQADGLAIASPSDDYRAWRSITAEQTNPELTDHLPGVPLTISPTGPGLPSNFNNDLIIARDGTIYVATTAGIAWSTDKAQTWQYSRGGDYALKVQKRISGPPAGWMPAEGALLFEDYCTSLAEDPAGNIIVGHLNNRGQILRPHLTETFIAYNADFECVPALVSRAAGTFAGTYGQGASFFGRSLHRALPVTALPPASPPPFPTAAQPPSSEFLTGLLAKIPPIPTTPGSVAFLGQDWMTQGDWMGRYGRQLAVLCATNAYNNEHTLQYSSQPISYDRFVGPNPNAQSGVSQWLRGYQSNDPRAVWDPYVGYRRQAEWVDNGQAFPFEVDGPDLCIPVHLPRGLFRVSLYLVNPDAHKTNNRCRDYLLDVKPFLHDAVAMYAQSAGIHTRVTSFWNGEYLQFLMVGPTDQCFILHRSFSKNAHCSGLFVDKLGDLKGLDFGPRPLTGKLPYEPPAAPEFANPSPDLQAAVELWKRLGNFPAPSSGIAGDRALAVLAYRTAAAEHAPDDLLKLWRWQIPLWTPDDRTTAQKFFLDAWWANVKSNPSALQTPHARQPEKK